MKKGLWVLLCCWSASYADVQLRFNVTEAGVPPYEQVLTVAPGVLRLDSASMAKQSLLLDIKRKRILILHHDAKSYLELGEREMALMAGIAPAAPRRHSKPGGVRQQGQWSCQQVFLMEETRAVGEACMARYRDLKITRADYQTVMQGLDLLFRFSQQLGGEQIRGVQDWEKYPDRLPIHYSERSGDAYRMSLTKVSSLQTGSISFQVPKGYVRQQIPLLP